MGLQGHLTAPTPATGLAPRTLTSLLVSCASSTARGTADERHSGVGVSALDQLIAAMATPTAITAAMTASLARSGMPE